MYNILVCDDEKDIVSALNIYLSTEGSGLGLSIANSLTALMHGTFDLSVDGDLFKVTLTFDRV